MSSQPHSTYLTAQQVAARYGMDIRWVYGCRTLPRRKLGKSLRFLESELDTWEKRHTGNTRVYTFHHFDPTPVIRIHRDYLRAVAPADAVKAKLASLDELEAGLAAFTKIVRQHIKALRLEPTVEAVDQSAVIDRTYTELQQ